MDFGMASGISQAVGSFVTGYYQNKVAKIQAGTANYIRGLNNETAKVENARNKQFGDLARWRQSVANTRVRENAAKDQESIEVNYWRAADQRRKANFSQQIRNAEEEGRMAAAAAMSGVSGSVVDMLNQTSKLRVAMENQQAQKTEGLLAHDKERLQFSQWYANLDQMDYSLIFDAQQTPDFRVDQPQKYSYLSGITTAGVKGIAQGVDFLFKQPTSNLDPFAYTKGTGSIDD